MNKRSGTSKDAADKLVRGIKRKTRKHYSAEEKIRIVLAGLRGEESISALCRREGIAESLYYSWSKEFLEAGKARLSGDTARQATAPEVKELRSESADHNKRTRRIFSRNSWDMNGRFYGAWWQQIDSEWRSRITIDNEPVTGRSRVPVRVLSERWCLRRTGRTRSVQL